MPQTKSVGWRRRIAPLALVLGAGLLGGCDQSGQAEHALRAAAEKLRLVNSGTGAPLPEQQGRRIYGEVRSLLAEVESKGVPAEQAAAKLMIAESQMGEAGLDARAATEALIESLTRVQTIQRLIAQWQAAVDASANVLASSVLDEVPALREKVAANGRDLAAKMQEKSALESESSALQARMSEMLAAAAEEHRLSGELKAQADAMSPLDSLPLIRQSQWHTRSADALEFEADAMEAQIASLAPQVREVQAYINQLTSDTAALEAAIKNFEAHDGKSKSLAAEFNSKADEIAAAVDQQVFGSEGLLAFRESALVPAVEKAVAAFEKASGTARGAQASLRNQAQSASGRALQSSGALQAQLASDQAMVLRLLDSLKAMPAYEGGEASELKEAHDKLTEARAATVEAAVTALESASEAIEGSGLRGDSAQLEAAHARNLIAASVRDLKGEEVDHARILSETRQQLARRQPPAGMGSDVGEGDAGTSGDAGWSDSDGGAASGEAALRARIDEMLDLLRNGQATEIAPYVRCSNPADEQLVAGLLGVMNSMLRMDRACKVQFGQGLGDAAAMMGGVSSNLDDASSDSVQIDIQGDAASVLPSNGADASDAIPFVLDGGEWKIDFDGFMAIGAADNPAAMGQLEQMRPHMSKLAVAYGTLADRVASGSFSSIDQVLQAIQTTTMSAIMPSGGG